MNLICLFNDDGKFHAIFDGINRIGNAFYPIRYKVEISNLAYGVNDDSSDVQSVACFPYNKLLPDEGGFAKEYLVSFHDFKPRNGFITYKIGSGNHHMGIINKFFKSSL